MEQDDIKVVYMHGFEREKMFEIMKAVKSVLENPKEVAFCTTTKNNINMKLSEMVPEVQSDHYHMVIKKQEKTNQEKKEESQ